MDIREILKSELVSALKDNSKPENEAVVPIEKVLYETIPNKTKISTIRLVLAAIRDKDIESRGKGDATLILDEDILVLLQSMIKQRNDSITQYTKATRDELVYKEQLEIKIIKYFLPKALSDEELNVIIDEIIYKLEDKSIKSMSIVVNTIKKNYVGRIDLAVVAKKVKEKLS